MEIARIENDIQFLSGQSHSINFGDEPSQIHFGYGLATIKYGHNDPGESNINIYNELTASSVMFFDNLGKVGINNVTPDAELDVDGKIKTTELFVSDQIKIGTLETASEYALAVNGTIGCEKIEVKIESNWPDFVFEDDYQHLSLKETEDFIKSNKHLPGVPSAADVEKNGIELGEMNAILLQKIEELTLLMIEQQKVVECQQKEIDNLMKQID